MRLDLVALLRDLLHVASETELYDAVARWARDHLDAARVSVTTVTADGAGVQLRSLSTRTSERPFPVGNAVPLAGTAVERVISTGNASLWHPSPNSTEPEGPALAEAGWGTVLNTPIRLDGTIIGTFNLAQPVGHTMTDLLVNASEEIADFVSVNLDRLQLAQHVRDDLRRARTNSETLSRLTHLAVELSDVDDEDRVLGVLAAELARIVPAERISLAMPTAERDQLRLTSLIDAPDDTSGIRPGFVLPLHGSGNGEVFRTGRSLVYPVLADSPYPEHRRLAENGIASGFCIPVPIGGQVGAVLNSGSRHHYTIDAEQLHALEVLAGLIGANLERIRAEAKAHRRSVQLGALVDDSPLLLVTVDADGHIRRLSKFAAARLGYDPRELENRCITTLYRDADQDVTRDEVGRLLNAPDGSVATWMATMRDAHGVEVEVRHTGRRLTGEASSDGDAQALIVCEDVTELQALSKQLEHHASHDPLTGLVNRREFDRRLAAAVSTGTGPVSLCFIDVDRFKLVNDTAGHPAGDRLLVDLANAFGAAIDDGDTLARIGGDEFALILHDRSLPDAARMAERLRTLAAAMTLPWDGRAIPISVSIGVAEYDRDSGIETLVSDADAACYNAKQAGRNRVGLAHAEVHEARLTDGTWLRRVQQAISGGGLRLAAQRIGSLDDDGLWNFEILVRLAEGDDLIPAGVFIPVTERYGLITDLDRWVVDEVIANLRDHAHVTDRIGFCTVNLSAKSIENEDFLDHLMAVLTAPGFPTEKLVFEITETTALSQFTTAIRFIESVSALGCRFALDDFGAGFSTYQTLRRLPVDILKIDGSLVRDIASDPVNREIVRSMAQVATAIEMSTVAEFVEDDETAVMLRDLGVDFAQGWAIHKPQPLAEVLELIATADAPLR